MNVQIYRIKDFLRKGETGRLDHARTLEIAVDLVKAAAQYPDKNILIDVRNTTITFKITSEVLRLAIDLQEFMPFLKNKIAALVPDETHRLILAKTLEACLQAKGAHYRVFTEHDKAIEWFSEVSDIGADGGESVRKTSRFVD